MELEKQTKFYQNTRNIKEAINHFTFHLSVFAIFEVFLIVLPFFVENELSLSIYYIIILVLTMPVAYLSWITVTKMKSYKSIQSMELPLLELDEVGFLYRVDLKNEYYITWAEVQKLSIHEVTAGKVTHKILEIRLNPEPGQTSGDILKISSYKFKEDMDTIFISMNDYFCQE